MYGVTACLHPALGLQFPTNIMSTCLYNCKAVPKSLR